MGLHIDYFASLNSPWTHFGAARLEAMAVRHGAALRIHLVDFAVIFPASGGVPVARRSPQRQAYRMQELARWCDHLGIPLHPRPRPFPADERLAAQCVIAARDTLGDGPAVALAHRLLRALWEEFEAGVTAEARFAMGCDRLQGFLQNVLSGGVAWREHGVTRADTTPRMAPAMAVDPAFATLIGTLYERARAGRMLPE